ncbi:MAG: hypothetical protein ABI599_00420 [Flavobacteriales bacterium]
MKLLLVALLFSIGGFFLGRHWSGCGHGCGDMGSCHGNAGCMHGTGDMHGASCCKGGHGEGMGHGEGAGKSCCKGHGDEHGEGHGEGMFEGNDDDQAHLIIKGLKDADFQGDTTIAIDGGTVHVKRDGHKMEVQVEMADSAKTTATSVEVH